MKKYMIKSNALRLTFLVGGLIMWTGILLTGFNAAHWILFIPATFFTFAGLSGICPGLIISKVILKEKFE